MYSQYKVSGYNITTDPEFQNDLHGNKEELVQQFEELYIECQNKKNKKIIGRLTTLIEKYPHSPQLKNFLSIAYHTQGNYKKAFEVNNWIMAEHPDYLFAKLNVAHKYMNAGVTTKVPEILGDSMEIKQLYPDRDLFHLAEVTGFYHAAIRYFAAIKNWELAENRFEVLKGIAPTHHDTEAAEIYLFPGRMEKNFNLWKEEEASKISVRSLKPVPSSKQIKAPVFNHIEIDNLYNYGIEIPPEILKEILALPRDTVVEDLEKVLLDSIERFQYFKDAGWEEDTHNFPLHAMCLLAELKNENSLEAVLDFLKNDDEVLEFWLGDHTTSTIWLPIYLLAQNNLESLHQFLLEPGIATYSKTAVSEALIQMALHAPEKRNEILSIYTDVFTYFNNATHDDNVIDSDLSGLLIGDMIDAGFNEMLPLIKKLYDKRYVNLTINGAYDEAESYFNKPSNNRRERKIENIFQLYTTIVNTWASYLEDEESFEDDYFEDDEIQVPAVSTKIGRNYPCPCGSGKKYKKCCMNKLPL